VEVKVETLAACKKKLSITIPREEIQQKLDERFRELEREAQVPGFRPGRAPRRLVEKRFHEAVHEEVRTKLVAESLEKAFDQEKLDVIGDPEVDPDAIQMPDDGPMIFSIDLEVRPEFDLPDYVGIPVSVARPVVGEKDVDLALERLRESHGQLEEVPPDGRAQEGDIITADLRIQSGETLVVDRPGVRLPVAAIAVEGIRLEVVAEMLKGAKAGQTQTATITIPEDYAREDLRGKPAEVRIKVSQVRRIALPTDEEVLKAADYENMDALRASVRRQLDAQSDNTFRQLQEQAIEAWLLERVPFDLPEELTKRHANSLLQRQLMNLQYRGVPVEEIEKRLGDIRSASTEQAARDLKLHFILGRIAKKETIEATDAEVDARLRFIAAQYGRRDDRLREEMEAKGTLDNLRAQIRDDKVMRVLLEKARIETPPAPPPAPEPEPAPSASLSSSLSLRAEGGTGAEKKTEAPRPEEKPKAETEADDKPKAHGKKKTKKDSGDVEST